MFIRMLLSVDSNRMFSILSMSWITGGLELLDAPYVETVLAGPRVGIEYAKPHDKVAKWRFAEANSPFVSSPKKSLEPIT